MWDYRDRIEKNKEEMMLVHQKEYDIYMDWRSEVMNLLPFEKGYVKIKRGDMYVYAKVFRASGPFSSFSFNTGYKALVTKTIHFTCIGVGKSDKTGFLTSNQIIDIDDVVEFTTEQEFQEVLTAFFDRWLKPTAENVKYAYETFSHDLEQLRYMYPDVFDRDDVNYFIKRFAYVDEHMDVPEEFNDWL